MPRRSSEVWMSLLALPLTWRPTEPAHGQLLGGNGDLKNW